MPVGGTFMKGPIPGQSLTKAPGESEFDRPPKIADPEQAFEVYLSHLDEPEKMDKLFKVLSSSVPISNVVTIWTRDGARKGIHSVDTGLALRPMLHEHVRTLAEEAGVEYVEFAKDLAPIKEAMNRRQEYTDVAPMVSKAIQSPSSYKEEEVPEEAAMMKPPRGIMARRGEME
jgi:hypothetical protein